MHNLIIRRSDAFDRVVQFGIDHPLTPAIPAVTTLFADLGAVLTALGHHADDQEIGRSEVHGGAAFRRFKADALLAKMRPINKMVRALNRDQYPGLREQFKMPQGGGYRALIARAQAFMDAIAPIKAVLTARGMPADFDEELETAKTDLAAATADKDSGTATRSAGTAGLDAKSHEGMGILHELDSILSFQYRNDPARLAGWKTACRVEKSARRSTSSAGSGSTGGGGGTTTPISAPAAK
jgi:hypothetical protein